MSHEWPCSNDKTGPHVAMSHECWCSVTSSDYYYTSWWFKSISSLIFFTLILIKAQRIHRQSKMSATVLDSRRFLLTWSKSHSCSLFYNCCYYIIFIKINYIWYGSTVGLFQRIITYINASILDSHKCIFSLCFGGVLTFVGPEWCISLCSYVFWIFHTSQNNWRTILHLFMRFFFLNVNKMQQESMSW